MSIPRLGKLRLARISDLPRIGIVMTAGFYYSPVFRYLRPDYKTYPQDTIASYQSECRASILDPDSVVIVAEQAYDEIEADAVFNELKQIYPPIHEQTPEVDQNGGTVIVGVATLSLKAVPQCSGRFLPDGTASEKPAHDPKDLGRDKCPHAIESFNNIQDEERKKRFRDCMEVTSIAVHPAYWRKGHGSDMAKEFMALADIYGKRLCVSAAPMGAELSKAVGFKKETIIFVDGYELHPDPIRLWFGFHQRPNGRGWNKRWLNSFMHTIGQFIGQFSLCVFNVLTMSTYSKKGRGAKSSCNRDLSVDSLYDWMEKV